MFVQITLFNDDHTQIKFLFILNEGQVNIEQGASGRGRKRDKEKQINKERDKALKSFGNGMGYKIDDWD